MSFSFSKKLFILVCIVVLLLIVLPLFYIVKSSFSKFGSYAYTVNEKQIKSMSSFYLSRIAQEHAEKYDEIFKKIEVVSSLMGRQAESIYLNLDALSRVPLKGALNLESNRENKIFFSPRHETVITLYWGGNKILNAVEKELCALSNFKSILIKSKELVNESLATYVITASGIGLYYTRNLKAESACYNLPPSSEFDLRDGEPVTVFTKSKIKFYDTKWTGIYKSDAIDGLMMTASTPIYGKNGEFKGITGIDIPVDYIIDELTQSAFISGNKNETILFAFLQNKEGKIIAFPSEFMELFGLNMDLSRVKNSSDIISLSLKDSSIRAVRMIAPDIMNSHHGIIKLVINNEKYLLAIGCLNSVDWHLVLVAGQAGMIVSLNKTRAALEKSLGTIWKDFLVYSLVVMVIFAVLLLCVIKIEKGHTLELENRIRLRTMELEKSNKELKNNKNEQNKIIAERTAQLKRLNEHIVFTEEGERKAIASDLHDSVTQTLAMSISKLKNLSESDKIITESELLVIQEYLDLSLREIRSLIYQLSPPILDDFDIDIALGFLIEETNAKYHSHFHYINNIEDRVLLDQALKVTLYRAVNELLTNILKHSGTRNGEVEVSKNKEKIIVRVEDKGAGFDINIVKATDSFGFGLHSLAERMENLGGKIQLESEPGKGTIIHLTAPVLQCNDKEYEKS
ncbi:MAG: hypothetical protein GXP56_08800 [Deltaproteobacteria bacterium]|nr:hypothetical protein [Deltaproteobacteria bacterium]